MKMKKKKSNHFMKDLRGSKCYFKININYENELL